MKPNQTEDLKETDTLLKEKTPLPTFTAHTTQSKSSPRFEETGLDSLRKVKCQKDSAFELEVETIGINHVGDVPACHRTPTNFTDLWIHPWTCHFQTCLSFFAFKVLLMFADVGTDLMTGIAHFLNGDVFWGSLTILVMFLPTIFTQTISLLNFVWYKYGTMSKRFPAVLPISYGWQHLPFIQGFRNVRILIGLATMDTTNPHNSLLISRLKSKANEISATEAILESAPQLILQLYILFSTGILSFYQVFGVIVSFISLWHTSLTLFFIARIGNEKEDNPSWMFKLSIAPFAFLDLFSSAILISSLAIFSKGIGLFGILLIISSNTILQIMQTYSSNFEYELDQSNDQSNSFQNQSLRKDVSKSLNLSALTSWMINTVIVKSKTVLHDKSGTRITKLQLYGSAISIGIYSLLNLAVISYQIFLQRNALKDFSVIVCSTEHPKETQENAIPIFFNTSSAVNVFTNITRKVVVRLCEDGEQPLDVLLKGIVPLLFVSVITKIVVDFILYKLSDYENLLEFTRMFGVKTFHFIHVIERPAEFKNNGELIQHLKRNIHLVNRQHPVTGETIMHLADELMTMEDIKMLYKTGAKIDIQDFCGKTAKESWNLSTSETLDQLTERETPKEIPSLEHNLDHLAKCVNNLNFLRFSIFVIIGFKPAAKNNFGESALDCIVDKLIDDPKSSLPFLRPLSYEDIHKIMTLIMTKMLCKEGFKKICMIFEAVETHHFLLRKSKTLKASPFVKVLFQQKTAAVGKETISELLLFYFTKTDDYETPLHHACAKGNRRAAQTILTSTVDPNIRGKNQETPLHSACQGGHADCVKFLLERKSDPNVQDKLGRSPLLLACKERHSDCVKLLLEAKADPNIHDEKFQTPLHFACKHGLSECNELLLDYKANPNFQDKSGRSPLHWACEKGQLGSVKLLLQSQADQNIPDENQVTPLELAIRKRHSCCVEFLRDFNDRVKLHNGEKTKFNDFSKEESPNFLKPTDLDIGMEEMTPMDRIPDLKK